MPGLGTFMSTVHSGLGSSKGSEIGASVRIITVCDRPFTGSKGQMSDQDLLWSDIILA